MRSASLGLAPSRSAGRAASRLRRRTIAVRSTWFAMFAPPGTPQPIVRKLSQEMNKVARDPELLSHLLKTASTPNPGTPEELDALLRRDHERHGKLVRRLNLRTK